MSLNWSVSDEQICECFNKDFFPVSKALFSAATHYTENSFKNWLVNSISTDFCLNTWNWETRNAEMKGLFDNVIVLDPRTQIS